MVVVPGRAEKSRLVHREDPCSIWGVSWMRTNARVIECPRLRTAPRRFPGVVNATRYSDRRARSVRQAIPVAAHYNSVVDSSLSPSTALRTALGDPGIRSVRRGQTASSSAPVPGTRCRTRPSTDTTVWSGSTESTARAVQKHGSSTRTSSRSHRVPRPVPPRNRSLRIPGRNRMSCQGSPGPGQPDTGPARGQILLRP